MQAENFDFMLWKIFDSKKKTARTFYADESEISLNIVLFLKHE